MMMLVMIAAIDAIAAIASIAAIAITVAVSVAFALLFFFSYCRSVPPDFLRSFLESL